LSPSLYRSGRLVWHLLAGIGLLVALTTLTPLVTWWAGVLAVDWREARGEVLIVPGGSLVGGQVLGESSYWRAVGALRVWREGTVRTVLLSGGRETPEGVAVAVAMRDFLVAAGVPPEAILLETASTSTRENALESARILQGVPGRIVLLTSDYHMFRALRVFRKAGIRAEPRPVPDARKRAARLILRWEAFLAVLAETAKIGGYWWQGWL